MKGYKLIFSSSWHLSNIEVMMCANHHMRNLVIWYHLCFWQSSSDSFRDFTNIFLISCYCHLTFLAHTPETKSLLSCAPLFPFFIITRKLFRIIGIPNLTNRDCDRQQEKKSYFNYCLIRWYCTRCNYS